MINMLHPHNLQYATPTYKQIFKYMLYLHFALILVTILKLCSALKFRTSICVYTKLLPILGHFLHFDPPNNLKNQSFEKILKKPEDIIILHLHTTNDDDMMYSY